VSLQPLTDAELDKLADILKRFGDKRARNLETLDGFFAALICGPDDVPPSEYLPEIWGGNMVNEPAFQTRPILQEFILRRSAGMAATAAFTSASSASSLPR
jgi:yecA family protein